MGEVQSSSGGSSASLVNGSLPNLVAELTIRNQVYYHRVRLNAMGGKKGWQRQEHGALAWPGCSDRQAAPGLGGHWETPDKLLLFLG